MPKLDRWRSGYWRALWGLLLALCLAMPNQPTHAAAPDTKWVRTDIPMEGEPGSWQLAPGSDVVRLASADGALYAAVKGLTYSLYRSGDAGYHWSHPGNVTDSIIDVKVPGRDYIYYATKTDIWRSADGGRTFLRLPRPGGASSNHVEITAIDVSSVQKNVVAAATRDTDPAEFGGVYLYDENDAVPAWTNTGLTGYDVYTVAFSPGYLGDREVVAVATNEFDTDIVFRDRGLAWGAVTGSARLNRDNSSPLLAVPALASASIAFPSDYHAEPAPASSTLFAAISTGSSQGDLYRIEGAPARSSAADLNVGWGYGLRNLDLGAVAVSGKATSCRLIVGAAASGKTYSSTNRGIDWSASTKPPTGSGITSLTLQPDGSVYSASTGAESAVAVSRDWGSAWSQVGLVDTTVRQIVDFAPGPFDESNQALFMITFGLKYSLWRSLNSGSGWERVFSNALPGVNTLEQVEVPPTYSI